MRTITENDLKETFGVRVKLPIGLINFRAYEESVNGIEEEIKNETMVGRKERLFKIRSQLKRILREL